MHEMITNLRLKERRMFWDKETQQLDSNTIDSKNLDCDISNSNISHIRTHLKLVGGTEKKKMWIGKTVATWIASNLDRRKTGQAKNWGFWTKEINNKKTKSNNLNSYRIQLWQWCKNKKVQECKNHQSGYEKPQVQIGEDGEIAERAALGVMMVLAEHGMAVQCGYNFDFWKCQQSAYLLGFEP